MSYYEDDYYQNDDLEYLRDCADRGETNIIIIRNPLDEWHNDQYHDHIQRQYEYNGYDEDTISSAFEGDPMNTWNVD